MTFFHSVTFRRHGSVILNQHSNNVFSMELFSASIAFILQPIGSVLSGIVLEPLGRKRSMILVNAPHIAGWLLLYYATSITDLYVAGNFDSRPTNEFYGNLIFFD